MGKRYPEVPLEEGDLHLVFDDTQNACKLFKKVEKGGEWLYSCSMRNDTVRRWFGRWGACPRGVFLLGAPSAVHAPAFGDWFTPLFDTKKGGPMEKGGRVGIGIHGGGSGLANPYARRQGWKPTHGCLRVQNEDNAILARHIREAQAAGRRAYVTVGGKAFHE